MGDVIAITDQSGQIVAQYAYDAWGNILNQTEQGLTVDNPFKYAGYMLDEETNMYYLMARYYHPKHGVFLSIDPDPGDEDAPITQNGYTYADNNPVMGVDPDGNYAMVVGVYLIPGIGQAALVATGIVVGVAAASYGFWVLGGKLASYYNTKAYDPDPFARPNQKKQGRENKEAKKKNKNWKGNSNKRQKPLPKHTPSKKGHKKY